MTQPANNNPAQAPSHDSQFALMAQRRFAPFFWTQFAGAANDNIVKFAVTIMLTYELTLNWMQSSQAGLVIGAAFIAPFLLFSATSGQLADKWPKTTLIRWVKNIEILIILLAGLGLVLPNAGIMLFCVFLMGLHSTVFGPVKYAYLPQALEERELTGGNGLIEMGTFVAILLGNVGGGILAGMGSGWPQTTALVCVALALLGRLAAHFIPMLPASDAQLRINWNPFTETWQNLRLAHKQLAVYRSILGISWMWFFGAAFLNIFAAFAKDMLHGDPSVASLLLVFFSIGIGIGSLLCETLSRRHVEIGLVPFGAIGMTIFSVALYYSSTQVAQHLSGFTGTMQAAAFIADRAHWHMLFDMFALSLFVGLYSVPMYALIQLRTPASHRSRIIAANNILNALFMIVSSILVGLLLAWGLSIPQIFLFLGIANALVSMYIFLLLPEYLLRFVSWILTWFVYRFRVYNDHHIPTSGPAILVCNHVSFIDAVLLMAASPRPIRFLMDHQVFRTPVLGTLFRLAKAIPVAPHAEDPAIYAAAFNEAQAILADGEILGIFPEGAISRDGQVHTFKGGISKILHSAQAAGITPPVIPMALGNLWGSFFSRKDGPAMSKPFRRGIWNRVTLAIGPPVPPATATPEELQQQVTALLNTGVRPYI